jgi:KaiC/GvpD/RAD55 family RecA-like ATPase
LQLLSNQIDRGMSGAPLWDVQGRRVVGMINAFWETTRHQDAWLALAIPTETLRTVCPLLQLSDLCPYRGLEPFTEADAEFFFGRERAVERLLERLRQEPRFLAVLGPSGSGKSSLVRAGLIPRLRRGAVPRSDRWAFIIIRPGRNPFGELEAEGLSGASQGLVEAVQNWQRLHPEAERLALVLDQFEELLVDCPEETRREFVAQLAALLDSSLPVTAILVMRDDFYSRFVQEVKPLVRWLEGGLANVPLTLEPDELRAMVEEPARAVGLALEEGLAEVIVREAMEATPQGAPGTILPLLEFALTGLWERREEGYLTHAAYQAIGGVTGGLTQWADGVLFRLDGEQRRLARRVLTDLVHLGDESRNIPDSRRRRTLDDLCRHEGEREAVHQVVRLLADARLLVTGRDLSTGQENGGADPRCAAAGVGAIARLVAGGPPLSCLAADTGGADKGMGG